MTNRLFGNLCRHHIAVVASVFGNPAQRLYQGAAYNLHTYVCVVAIEFKTVERLAGVDQCRTATGYDAFFKSRAGRRHSVFDAVLTFLSLNLGCRTHLDHAHATGELRQAFLELFAIPLGIDGLDLSAQLLHTVFNRFLAATAVHNRGGVLGDGHAARRTGFFESCLGQVDTQFGGNHDAAGQNGEILHNSLAAIAESGSLKRHNVESSAELIHHEGGQCFTINVFGDNGQRFFRLYDLLQQRHNLGNRRDLTLVEQNEAIFKNRFATLGIGHERRRKVALVELHTLGNVKLNLSGGAVLDSNDAVLTDLLKSRCQKLADLVGLSRNSGNMRNFRTLYLAGILKQTLGDLLNGGLNATLHLRRCRTACYVAQPLIHKCLRQHGCGGRTVTGNVVSLGGYLFGELRAQVFVGVFKLDFAGDRDTIIRDNRCAPLFIEHNIAPAWAKGDLDRIGEFVDAGLQGLTGGIIEFKLLSHEYSLLLEDCERSIS